MQTSESDLAAILHCTVNSNSRITTGISLYGSLVKVSVSHDCQPSKQAKFGKLNQGGVLKFGLDAGVPRNSYLILGYFGRKWYFNGFFSKYIVVHFSQYSGVHKSNTRKLVKNGSMLRDIFCRKWGPYLGVLVKKATDQSGTSSYVSICEDPRGK